MATTPVLGMTEMTSGQSAKHTTFNDAINTLEAAISGAVLASGITANLQNGDAKTNLYTVPTGYKCIITAVVVREPTGSMAGGTDFDFGDGANADTWVTAVDLSALGTTDYFIIRGDNQPIAVLDAADVFGVKPVTGATADVDATIDVIGYLYEE